MWRGNGECGRHRERIRRHAVLLVVSALPPMTMLKASTGVGLRPRAQGMSASRCGCRAFTTPVRHRIRVRRRACARVRVKDTKLTIVPVVTTIYMASTRSVRKLPDRTVRVLMRGHGRSRPPVGMNPSSHSRTLMYTVPAVTLPSLESATTGTRSSGHRVRRWRCHGTGLRARASRASPISRRTR